MEAYVDWVIDTALPTWAERGFDPLAGRFAERLDDRGERLDLPHRAMVQARQIYVYAHAAELGWFAGGALAEAGMATLRRDYIETSGSMASVAFSIDPGTGLVISSARDSYTHAFVLFALAQLYALNGESSLLALSDGITEYIEKEMLDPVHGGVFDVLPPVSPTKRQNPQMHLLEAYLALELAAPGRGYLDRAERIVALFYERLTSREHGVLLEHFDHDWRPHPDPERSYIFEPGHHYEWIWLLHRHEKLSGADHREWRMRLNESATRHGISTIGPIVDEMTAEKAVMKPSFRLWPHTEAIKAAAVNHIEGDPEALSFARRMAAILFDHFLDTPFIGGWRDQLNPDLTGMVDYVPASSLYHLMLAATEADRHLSEAAATPIRSGPVC